MWILLNEHLHFALPLLLRIFPFVLIFFLFRSTVLKIISQHKLGIQLNTCLKCSYFIFNLFFTFLAALKAFCLAFFSSLVSFLWRWDSSKALGCTTFCCQYKIISKSQTLKYYTVSNEKHSYIHEKTFTYECTKTKLTSTGASLTFLTASFFSSFFFLGWIFNFFFQRQLLLLLINKILKYLIAKM